MLGPQPLPMPSAFSAADAGLHVAAQVRDIRKARHLSQRQLASRMQVPRTYISKIENGKAIPTLGSLERLAEALQVDVSQLVRDARSRREEEVAAILADPFLVEVAALLPHLDSLQRPLFSRAVRDGPRGSAGQPEAVARDQGREGSGIHVRLRPSSSDIANGRRGS